MQRTYEAKTQNQLFYDRSLTHKGVGGGGSGGKRGWLPRLLTEGFPIPLNTL